MVLQHLIFEMLYGNDDVSYSMIEKGADLFKSSIHGSTPFLLGLKSSMRIYSYICFKLVGLGIVDLKDKHPIKNNQK